LTGTAPAASPTPTASASSPTGAVLADSGSAVDLWAGAGAALAVLVGSALVLVRRRSAR
jgi:hypothetical protein